ncbi:hypothetical protein MHK_006407 [Candidatus Magnetomorum sp. HK-1]|nr:hypothetical protein MHK_006407 [Candidatus Magnetomorum sp. HK-1]
MNENLKILFVDDDEGVLKSYTRYLEKKGYDIDTFTTIDTATEALDTDQYAVAIIDMDFPKEPEGGIRIVNHIKNNNIDTKPIIFTAKGSIQNFRKILNDIFDYIEKGAENAINDLLKRVNNAMNLYQEKQERSKSETERKEIENKYNELAKQSNVRKTPIYQSAHTFEKCYNIPTRNFCYRIRQKVPLRYEEAHSLIDFIDHSIDLWANLFSMELNDPRTKKDISDRPIEGIDAFKWGEIKNDFHQFVEQNFIMNSNDLFDHYTNEYFYRGDAIVILSDIYDKEFAWDKFINFTVDGEDNIQIKGVRPYFRAVLINLITNAVEAIDLYYIFKNNHERAQIKIYCQQDESKTVIEILNTGKGMTEERAKHYNKIFEMAENGKLQLSEDLLENDIRDKKFTSKPGIGSGYALIHAAHYFSRIEKKQNTNDTVRGKMLVVTSETETKITITLPFGKKDEKNCFRWQKNEEISNNYKKMNISEKMGLDNILSDCRESLKELKIEKDRLKKEVLIVEDSRPDRFRMRMIIDNLNFQFRRFAWDASKKAVLSVETIEELMKKTQPNILILDLAWTPKDEKYIHDMLFQTKEGIKEIVNNYKPNSFKFLDKIQGKPGDYDYLDIIIIMSQFVSPITDGLKSYINNIYFNKMKHKGIILQKWRQENEFRQILIRNHRRAS